MNRTWITIRNKHGYFKDRVVNVPQPDWFDYVMRVFKNIRFTIILPSTVSSCLWHNHKYSLDTITYICSKLYHNFCNAVWRGKIPSWSHQDNIFWQFFWYLVDNATLKYHPFQTNIWFEEQTLPIQQCMITITCNMYIILSGICSHDMWCENSSAFFKLWHIVKQSYDC